MSPKCLVYTLTSLYKDWVLEDRVDLQLWQSETHYWDYNYQGSKSSECGCYFTILISLIFVGLGALYLRCTIFQPVREVGWAADIMGSTFCMEQQQRPLWRWFMIWGGRLRSKRLYSLFNLSAQLESRNIDEGVMSATFHVEDYLSKGHVNLVPCDG
jgi:hypothetical protein